MYVDENEYLYNLQKCVRVHFQKLYKYIFHIKVRTLIQKTLKILIKMANPAASVFLDE